MDAGAQPKQGSRIGAFLWLVFAAVGVGLLLWGLQPRQVSQSRRPAPDFTLEDRDGAMVSLAGLQGKPVFINFWATWCGPCRAELPLLQALYQKHRDQMHFLFISTDSDWDIVKTYLAAAGFDIPVLLDADQAVFGRYNTRYLPTTFTLDRDLGIITKFEGALSEADAKQFIDEALERTEASDTAAAS